MPKTTKYAFVKYVEDGETPEETLKRIIDFLTASHYQAVISPLHDSDVWSESDIENWITSQQKIYAPGRIGEQYFSTIDWNADTYLRPAHRRYIRKERRWVELPEERVRIHHVGDLKKAHYHVYVHYETSVELTQALEDFKPLGVTYFEIVKSQVAYIRYLPHLDNPEKVRYDVNRVISLGGIDISPLYVQTDAEKMELNYTILDLIEDYDVFNFFKLISLCKRDYKLYAEVKGYSRFWIEYIRDRYNYLHPKKDKEE